MRPTLFPTAASFHLLLSGSQPITSQLSSLFLIPGISMCCEDVKQSATVLGENKLEIVTKLGSFLLL